jgi:iron complex transport system substrate-binding protein
MSKLTTPTFCCLILCIVLVLSACTATATPVMPSPTVQAPIALTDGLGRTITLSSPAQRVVSLAPSNTEIMFAIGAGSQLVGRDAFSDYPEEAQLVTDIGGGFGELESEVIVSLQPDLVLASDLTPPEQIQLLEELGITVFSLSNPTEFDGLYTNILTVATLSAHEAEGQALVESLKGRVTAVEQKITSVQDRPLVYYELDGTDPNAPWTPGPGTFISMLINKAGGENLGNMLQSEWAQISIETLIEQDPQIILLGNAHWGGITPEGVAARSGWDILSAVQDGQIFPFDDNLVSRPGPRLVDGLEDMAAFLHPELFQ